MKTKLVLLLALPLLAACGVPKSQYDAAVADGAKSKTECEQRASAAQAELQKQIDDLKSKLAEAESKADATSQATRGELEELRRQKAAAEQRAKLFEEFIAKFKKMIDAGKLAITVRHGQIVLALGTDILFDTGKTEIKPEGQAALAEVADALKTVGGRRFQVSGHTDNVPIKTKEFPSNWELSTARAVAVVKLLLDHGVKADSLSAAGYAEFDPSTANANERGRSKNRRIEIVVVPNIEELVRMPELAGKTEGAGPGDQAPGAASTSTSTSSSPAPSTPSTPPAPTATEKPPPPPPPPAKPRSPKPPKPKK